MKYFIFIFAFFLSITSFAQTLKNPNTTPKKIQGNLVHNVFFWLKNPDNAKERQAFEKGANELLNNCKYISSSHFGTPANTEKRSVVDASFTYNAVIIFDSKESHDSYQIDPLHKKFIEECKDLWNKVVVYDSKPLKSTVLQVKPQ